jgi:hypothetical protein
MNFINGKLPFKNTHPEVMKEKSADTKYSTSMKR